MNEKGKYFKKLEKKPFGIFKRALCSNFFAFIKHQGYKRLLDSADKVADYTEDKADLLNKNETTTHDTIVYMCEFLLAMGKTGIHGIRPTNNMCQIIDRKSVV